MTDFRGLCQCTNTWAFQEPLEKPLTFGSNVTSFGQSALLLKTDFSSVLMAVNVSGNCSARRYTTTPHSSLESFPRSSGIHRISERTLLKTYFSIQLHLLSDKKTAVLFRSHSTSLWCRRWPQGHVYTYIKLTFTCLWVCFIHGAMTVFFNKPMLVLLQGHGSSPQNKKLLVQLNFLDQNQQLEFLWDHKACNVQWKQSNSVTTISILSIILSPLPSSIHLCSISFRKHKCSSCFAA